ncbi:DUF4145 domain-containing protein [Tardiphaga sp. 839_C3_N1_4]|uniref:DUF4145 domain-containing protein n=1 Tax=Tardiphaga sp. 839_C3_N1_4 TaxID=3240761 RepID=UPI003F224361
MAVKKLSTRFAELLDQAKAIEATRATHHSEHSGRSERVDSNALLGWEVKCKSLLATACGISSEHYRQFLETEKDRAWRDSWSELQQLKAILLAAQEDYDGGYLDAVRSLVQAELFSDELDQAQELLRSGYYAPAAVVAGVVLESKLRDLCAKLELPLGKLDKMNSDLAKAGVYSLFVQKRITSIADVRNNAAHGHPEKFTAKDVGEMIDYIERFLGDHG